ncbi:hypothetical protein PUN28_012136 [Cardiocondyla obscurior]|uniref:Uncharacterized protein n=1 Tax=Cardiocondyla obscurior TaxID=286306 RepID=A0AAW2F9M4_9HYME
MRPTAGLSDRIEESPPWPRYAPFDTLVPALRNRRSRRSAQGADHKFRFLSRLRAPDAASLGIETFQLDRGRIIILMRVVIRDLIKYPFFFFSFLPPSARPDSARDTSNAMRPIAKREEVEKKKLDN